MKDMVHLRKRVKQTPTLTLSAGQGEDGPDLDDPDAKLGLWGAADQQRRRPALPFGKTKKLGGKVRMDEGSRSIHQVESRERRARKRHRKRTGRHVRSGWKRACAGLFRQNGAGTISAGRAAARCIRLLGNLLGRTRSRQRQAKRRKGHKAKEDGNPLLHSANPTRTRQPRNSIAGRSPQFG